MSEPVDNTDAETAERPNSGWHKYADGDGQHTFTVTVSMRGHNSRWTMGLLPQEILADNLHDALALAQQIPFKEWFSDT